MCLEHPVNVASYPAAESGWKGYGGYEKRPDSAQGRPGYSIRCNPINYYYYF